MTRWGGGQDNPTVDELRAALAELDTPDTEHPSTWLSDHDGWTVDVYERGLVIFSHRGGDICERRGLSRDEALELWLLLQQGKRDEIKRRLSSATRLAAPSLKPKRPFLNALIILGWTLAVIVIVPMIGGITVATLFHNSDEAYLGLTLLFMLFTPIALLAGFILAVRRFIKERRAQRTQNETNTA